jgi:hypothetical protein
MFAFTNEFVEVTPDELVIKANDSREFIFNYRPLISALPRLTLMLFLRLLHLVNSDIYCS